MILSTDFDITTGTFVGSGAVATVLLTTTDTTPDGTWCYRAVVSGYLTVGGVKQALQIDFTGENESAVGASLMGTEWSNTVAICSQVPVGPQKPAIRLTLLGGATFDMVDGGELSGTYSCEATDTVLAAVG